MRSVIFDPALRFVPLAIVWARRSLSRVFEERPAGALDSLRRAQGEVLLFLNLTRPTLL